MADLGQDLGHGLALDKAAPVQPQIQVAKELRAGQGARPIFKRIQPARRPGRAHKRAHATARNHIRRDPLRLKPAQHADVAPAPRPARAQRKAKGHSAATRFGFSIGLR